MSWWGVAISLGAQFVVWGVQRWAVREEKRTPPRPQDFDIARTAEGSPVPIVYGQCRVDTPILAWFGNQDTRQNSAGAFDYGLDMLFVIGVPAYSHLGNVDETTLVAPTRLVSVFWGDLQFQMGSASVGLTPGGIDEIGDALALGGPGAGGGLNVDVQFFDGAADQQFATALLPSTRFALAGASAALIPDYRHQISAFLSAPVEGGRLGVGESPNLPQISFEVATANRFGIGSGANPAWVIYDLITSPIWKVGKPAAEVDLAGFQAVAATLDAEGQDYSAALVQGESAGEIIAGILAQIDGVLYEDQADGLIKLRLIRADYDPNTIPELTTDNTLGRPKVTINGPASTVNQVLVTYRDRSRGYKQNQARAQNLANIFASNNRIRSVTVEMPGVCTAALAAKIAARELAARSTSYKTALAKVNREFYDLAPGDVVKANWPTLGVVDTVFRVVDINLGSLADGAIELTLVEDVFGNQLGGFVPPDGDITEGADLVPLVETFVAEAPYGLIYQAFQQGAISSLDARVMAFAVAEGSAAKFRSTSQYGGILAGAVYTAANPMTADVPLQTFPFTATVATAYARTAAPYDTATGLVIENVGGGRVGSTTGTAWLAELIAAGAVSSTEIEQGENLMIAIGADGVENEFFAFESVVDLGGGQYRLTNVWRGLFDTVPLDLEVGCRIYRVTSSCLGTRAFGNNAWVNTHVIPYDGQLQEPTSHKNHQIRIGTPPS